MVEPMTIVVIIGVGTLIIERLSAYIYRLKNFRSQCCNKEVINIQQEVIQPPPENNINDANKK